MEGKAIPPGEGDDPLVHSGDKRHRRDLIDEESDRENNVSEIRRTSSLGALVKDESEEPCTKIARRPHDSTRYAKALDEMRNISKKYTGVIKDLKVCVSCVCVFNACARVPVHFIL